MSNKFIKYIPGLLLVVFPMVGLAERHEMQGTKEQQEMRGMKSQQEMQQMQGMQGQMHEGKDVYGWQLMSPEERKEYRKKIGGFKSEEERQEFLEEHREKMQERADEMGVELPKMRGEQ